MSFKVRDCVQQLASGAGTGDLVLGAVPTGYLGFNDTNVFSAGDTFCYEVHGVDGAGARTGEWEVGIGQFYLNSTVPTLRRVLKLAGSNAPATTMVDFAAGDKVVSLTAPARQVEGANIVTAAPNMMDIYVSPAGSDSNHGFTSDSPLLTLNAAAVLAMRFSRSDVHLAAGAYSGYFEISGAGRHVTVFGAGPATTTFNGALGSVEGAFVQVYDLAVEQIYAMSGGKIEGDNLRFLENLTDVHVSVFDRSRAELGNYEVVGNAYGHLYACDLSAIYGYGEVTISADISIETAWAKINYGPAKIELAQTFAGTGVVTGKRFDIQFGGVCQVDGAGDAYLPGSVAGTATNGGFYG